MRRLSLTLALVLLTPWAATARDVCLDYWSVGPSECNGVPEPAPAPVVMMPTPSPSASQAKPALDPAEQRIQEFYQTYDKPPRAFVEFQVNPSPATALAWVQEYQNIINRSSQTTQAWTQAEAAYQEFQRTGKFPESFTAALSEQEQRQLLSIVQGNNQSLPPIPSFGPTTPSANPLPQVVQNAVRGLPNTSKPAAAQAPRGQNALSAGDLNRGSRTQNATADTGRLSMATLNRGAEPTAGGDVIKINYYFSAKCPFCQRFEPEFAQVLQQFTAKRVEVTCVDMTPGEKNPDNKRGLVPCTWRPLAPGEKDANQIRATPSVLIDFGPTQSLELVEGYVPGNQLLSYLNQKAGL